MRVRGRRRTPAAVSASRRAARSAGVGVESLRAERGEAAAVAEDAARTWDVVRELPGAVVAVAEYERVCFRAAGTLVAVWKLATVSLDFLGIMVVSLAGVNDPSSWERCDGVSKHSSIACHARLPIHPTPVLSVSGFTGGRGYDMRERKPTCAVPGPTKANVGASWGFLSVLFAWIDGGNWMNGGEQGGESSQKRPCRGARIVS